MTLDDYYKHLIDREYMSGINRSTHRVNNTAEVFTPTECVNDICIKIQKKDKTAFSDSTNTFLDRACGDGQFLANILFRKIKNGIDFKTALGTIYGVDLMQDNVELCRERLLCGREDLRHIVEKNIVCADGLRYHYRFDNSYPYDDPKFDEWYEKNLEVVY
jgi:SAM-dependent methyltransferase